MTIFRACIGTGPRGTKDAKHLEGHSGVLVHQFDGHLDANFPVVSFLGNAPEVRRRVFEAKKVGDCPVDRDNQEDFLLVFALFDMAVESVQQ